MHKTFISKVSRECQKLLIHFQEVQFNHIPHEHNRLVNELAQVASRSHLFGLAINEKLII